MRIYFKFQRKPDQINRIIKVKIYNIKLVHRIKLAFAALFKGVIVIKK
jgi:hypothetical protein